MAQETQNDYISYPVFRGLQRPLEFMGLQGRYIGWAAGTAGGAIIGFIAAYIILGFIAGLIVAIVAVITGVTLIITKSRKGLHSKKVMSGEYVFAYRSRYL